MNALRHLAIGLLLVATNHAQASITYTQNDQFGLVGTFTTDDNGEELSPDFSNFLHLAPDGQPGGFRILGAFDEGHNLISTTISGAQYIDNPVQNGIPTIGANFSAERTFAGGVGGTASGTFPSKLDDVTPVNFAYVVAANGSGSFSFTVVPEPSTYAMVGVVAVVSVAGYFRRRKQTA